jgi:transposase InsO family protein
MSERRACHVIGADRKSVRYRSQRAGYAELREKLRELANQRRRFGYRRLHILLRREGVMINRKKTQRLYREEGLAVRRRRSRERAVWNTGACSGACPAEPALEPRLRARPNGVRTTVKRAERGR